MLLKLLIGVFLCAFLKNVCTIETTRESEGYPHGYLSDCPGVTKEAKISKRSLRHLYFFQMQPGNFLTANRTLYNYFQMEKLAKRMDFRKKTLLLMAGYMDSLNLITVAPPMGLVYMSLGYNVLLMEYIQFSARPYPIAARLLRPVGRRTAEMLAELTKLGLDPKKLEVLGVSHGGQGISFIGKSYQHITGRNISRITSLDPSGPCFRRLGPEDRIDASDADMVDVIHTNMDGFGYSGPVGHVNFYVNGGEYQILDFPHIPCTSFCSHAKVYVHWVSAMLHPDSFIGVKCDTVQDARDRNCSNRPLVTNVMGPKTDFTTPGIFYLQTKNYYPYFMGKKGIEKDFDLEKVVMSNMNKEDVMVV